MTHQLIKAPTVALAGTLLIAAPAFANSGHVGHAHSGSFRTSHALNPPSSGKELRHALQQPTAFVPSINFSNHSQLINEIGKSHSVTRGLELDLTSDERSIVLGGNLFANASYSINSGGEQKVLTAGSKVSAAEYVALQQVIAGGAQNLVVDGSGRGVSGQFNLNSIKDGGTNLRAASLVIPESVSAVGDFSRQADGLRVTNDLVNHGSIYAYANKDTVRIAARDINNESGGLISTDVPASLGNTSTDPINLSLRADRDINNAGSIVSSGSLELSTGGSLKNEGNMRANGSVSILSSNVTNSGVISSLNSDVNFASVGNADLNVNNFGGTISAANGGINIRSEQYNGIGNSTVNSGDLLSRDLNLFAGQGTCNVFVNELTGVVQSSGSAVHVSSNTDTLTIGSQCLNGDPTYFNNGNIVIQNNIVVQQDLAIIASGDITTTATSLLFQTQDINGQGHNIVIIAGANITGGTGPVTGGNLPGQPPITQNATGDVTIDGAGSAGGGKVDLSNASVSLSINSSSTGSQQDGGSVLIAAFGGSTAGSGAVLLTPNSSIQALGTGQGNNGNITVLASGSTNSKAIVLGDIFARNGTGTSAGTGNVSIFNQPIHTSDGNAIIFDTNGAITTGNRLEILSASGFGTGTLSVGNISTTTNVTIIGGGLTTVGAINAHSIFPSGDSGIVSVRALNGAVQIGSIDIGAEGNGKAGAVSVQSFSDVVQSSIGKIDAFGGASGSNGGTVNIICAGNGGLALTGDINTTAPGGIGGDVSIAAGSGGTATLTASNVTVNTAGSGSNGKIAIDTGKIDVATKLVLLANDSNQGGAISITTANGGIKTSGGDFTADSSSKISINLSNLLIDANGVISAGGNVKLNAPLIIGAPAADPTITALFISANGDNASGGSIDFSAPGNTQLTTIGQSFIKIPKGPSLVLHLQANADQNAATANGGSISVRVGGSILSGTDRIDVGGPNDGGLIRLTAGLAAPKKGATLVVEGNISADGGTGSGGQILLTSASKTNFVIGSFKVPKNGTMFFMDSIGTNGTGLVNIKNNVGGIQIAQNLEVVTTGVISLNASGKGRISSAKNTVVRGDTVEVNSDLGDISVECETNNLEFNTNAGDVTLVNDRPGNTVLFSSLSNAGIVSIITAGGLTLNDVTTNGDTAFVADKALAGGSLTVTSNITVNNGGLTLQNLDVANGDISFNNNLTVQTIGKGDDVAIVIGAVPKKPLNPLTAKAGFTINPTGKGQVFFGQDPAGIATPPTNVTLNATNKNVILNNASTGFKLIDLGNNNVITADPPSAVHVMPALYVSGTGSAGGSPAHAHGSVQGNSSKVEINTSMNLEPSTALLTDTLSIAEKPSAFVWTDDDLGLNDTMMIGKTHDTTNGDSKFESATLRKGAILFAPSKQTQIDTSFGTVTIDKGAIAFVVIDENKLAVYNLHDTGRGGVSVSTRSLKHEFMPGRCAVISNRVQHRFETLNPIETVGYRSVSTHFGNGLKYFNAEFSAPHLINSVAPLQAILHSNKASAKRIRNQLMKTTAVLMYLGAGKEPFRVYAEPNVTAMN